MSGDADGSASPLLQKAVPSLSHTHAPHPLPHLPPPAPLFFGFSPLCAPQIELAINTIKSWMRHHRDDIAGMDGFEIIDAAYDSITPEFCTGFIDHCGIYQWAVHPTDRLRQRAAAEQAALLLMLAVECDSDSDCD